MSREDLMENGKKPQMDDSVFLDLNLDLLFDEIFGQETTYCCDMPDSLEAVIERQELMQELEDEEVEEAVRKLLAGVRKAQEYEENAGLLGEGDGYASWHLKAAVAYYQALDECMAFLEERQELSTGIQKFVDSCRGILEEPDYCRNHDLAIRTQEALSKLRYGMRIEKECITILPEKEEDLIADLSQKFPMQFELPDRLPRLLPGSGEATKLERQIFSYLEKRNPDVFREMRLFAKECKVLVSETILRYCEEFSFYLSFLAFRRSMESSGHAFCYPKFCENGMEVSDGYDLALAMKNQMERKETVSNTYYFEGKERFFVVTGPNQGGKTTFGRSVGQLIYFANMGFPVPAKKAVLPYFSGIVTHFSVEESMESGRGKLKEELVRLAPIMHGEQKNVFVIINELFTSAATYDATQMGKRVMEHFLKQNCYGIYVTHVDELAKESEEIVSLVASVGGGSEHIRTYKIVRHPASGKGYAETIVKQFGLGYDDIVRRLGHD